MSTTTVRRPVPLGSHLTVVVNYRIENRGQHAPMLAASVAEPVEHELGDRSVPDQVGMTQDLKVPGHGWLGQLQHSLEVRDEERGGGKTVENPEPGGLRNRYQQVRGSRGAHIRVNEYTGNRMDARTGGQADRRDRRDVKTT